MVNLHGMQRLCQAALMVGLKVITCVRTANMGTHFCEWYCFLACTRPPDCRCTRTLAIKITEWVQPTCDCFIIVSYLCRTALSRVQHWGCHTIVNIESFRFGTHLLVQWVYHEHRLQRLCSRAHLLARFRGLVQSEFRLLRCFTDAWKYTSTRILHLPRISISSSRSRTYLPQGYGGYMVYILVVVEMCFHYSSNG
jgi:hypothetical protein